MIVDLGIPSSGSIEQVAAHALGTLANLRGGRFAGTVSVSFEFNGTRVSAWPDDTVQTVFARWREERAKQQIVPTAPGYVGKHLSIE